MRIPSWAAALLFACAVAPAFAAAAPPSPCDPAGAGAPCGGEQVAGIDHTGGTNQGAGNPVNLITGNKYQREADMAALPGVLGLELVRHYNSSHALSGESPSELGRGWQLSYETRLYPIGANLHIVQADGARLVFARSIVGAGLYRHADPARGAVRIAKLEGGDEYAWIWPNGRELRFDRNGRLIRIALPSGEALSLQRTPEGRLLRVRDPQGRELRIRYRSDQAPLAGGIDVIASIDTPVGRFLYEHRDAAQPARLSAVDLPGAAGKPERRIYHYEDRRFPLLLTGISVEGGAMGPARERIASWAYDAAGSAVLSAKGELLVTGADGKPAPGSGNEQLGFRRESPGMTVLTDGAGRVTRVRHALIDGEFRVLEARGAGCPSCGPVNLRYGYDKLGRLTEVTRLDASGAPVEGRLLALDALGRLLTLTRIDYANQKPARRTLLMRQQFSPEIGPFLWPWQGRARPPFGPLLIAWPSVLPGREHQLRIAYNRRQQPLLLSESGFDPVDGSRIERSIRYRYEEIRGRSLLLEIDGPLPNGGADADITRHVWDEAGNFIARSILPGNAELLFRRDEESGRLSAVTMRWDDVTLRRSFAYSPSGLLLRQTDAALDAEGRVMATRQTEITIDARGRLGAIRWPDGSAAELKRDAAGLPQPLALPGGGLASWPQQREPQAAEAAGALRAIRGAPGSAADGIVLRYDAGARSAERRLDDFGRVVALRLPEQGWQSARYDAADRLLQITDPRGAKSELVRDGAGRLLSVARVLADGSMAQQLRFAWRGPYRIEEAVHEQDGLRHVARYRHGAWGEVESSEVEIFDGDGAPLRMALQSRHDEAGRLVAQTLPGGERIVWRHFAPAPYRGQRAAVERLRWPAWLDRFMLKLPEAWLDACRLKVRLAELEPQDREAALAEAQNAAAPPQPEPGLATAAPGSERDAAGLPHRLRTAKGEFTLRWNALGALAEVRAAGTGALVARYSYDARGRRAAKHSAAGSEYYLYDGTQLVAVAVRDGKHARVRSEYLYAGYRPLLWFRDGRAQRMETDHRGAVLAVTALDSEVSRWRSNIDAWGQAHPAGEGDPRLRLVNQYADEETGLSYHLARYYDPGAGRYLSPDPSGIADSIDVATPQALKLDISAYVSGQPNLYFDPDAAAKLIYYALTTDAKGKALSMQQGFTRARWAFSIEGIQANASTGDEALDKLIRNYADKQAGLLYDFGGDFIKIKGRAYASWEGAADETVDQFKKHYDGKMVQLPQFTFVDFSDRDAALLIARLTGNTKELGSCPAASTLLPEIRFADEEVPIKVTSAAYKDPKQDGKELAKLQRIVICGPTNNEKQRRIKKYNYAAMLLESSPPQINMDCSKNGGCPGTSLGNTVLSNYVASYGPTQFILSTMLANLESMHNDFAGVDDKTRALLRLDDNSIWGEMEGNNKSRVGLAKDRAAYIAKQFADRSKNGPDWGSVNNDKKQAFMSGTGLSLDEAATTWNDINRWKNNPSANLSGEASAAFASKVILSDATLRSYLMEIIRDNEINGKFNRMSEYFLAKNYDAVISKVDLVNGFDKVLSNGEKNPKWVARQREIEIEIAARVARLHNGDLCAKNSLRCQKNVARTGELDELFEADARSDGRQYSRRFLSVSEYPVSQSNDEKKQQPTAEYFSLRCAEEMKDVAVPRGGVQLMPLVI